MRRVLLFAAFLLLLGLTTATAASFDVQAEDITSFSTAVTVSVPVPPPAPVYYLSGAAPLGSLVYPKPTGQSAVESGRFIQAQSLDGENRPNGPGPNVYYMRWASPPQPNGTHFEDKKVVLEFYSPGSTFTGFITAGLYDCPATAPSAAPTLETQCELLVRWDNNGSSLVLTSPRFTKTVDPGHELRLKVVNLAVADWTIQWGYKDQNRFANFSVIDGASP